VRTQRVVARADQREAKAGPSSTTQSKKISRQGGEEWKAPSHESGKGLFLFVSIFFFWLLV